MYTLTEEQVKQLQASGLSDQKIRDITAVKGYSLPSGFGAIDQRSSIQEVSPNRSTQSESDAFAETIRDNLGRAAQGFARGPVGLAEEAVKEVTTGGVGRGLVKSLGEMVSTAGRIGTKIGQSVLSKPVSFLTGKDEKAVRKSIGAPEFQKGTPEFERFQESLKPETTGEKVGKFIGDVASFEIPGSLASKATKGASLLSTVLARSGTTTLVSGLQQGEIDSDTALAVGLEALFPLLSKTKGGLASVLRTKPAKNKLEAVGKIVQGKIKDRGKALRVLSELDTSGVKTYQDLTKRVQTEVAATLGAVDRILSKDKTRRLLSELETTSTTKAGTAVSTNFVERALDDLESLYSTIGDDVSRAEIQELRGIAKNQGLTNFEINTLAREYGRELGQKGFSKVTGEPLTSVNAQKFENTRSMLKELAWDNMNDKSRLLDKKASAMIRVKDLVATVDEKVSKLKQRTIERGFGEKTVRAVFDFADAVTLGGVRGLVSKIKPSNVGEKTMNYLDIEKALPQLLKMIEDVSSVTDETSVLREVGKAIKSLAKPTIQAGLTVE